MVLMVVLRFLRVFLLMKTLQVELTNMITSFRVGFFLGIKQIKRASIWTTILIVFIMMLTFLNLVGVSGILVGLFEGAVIANRNQYTGDVFISTPTGEK